MELIGKVGNDSREQVRRYIRLTYLIPELLQLVDNSVLYNKKNCLTIGLTTAVELSYLTKDTQKLQFYTIEYVDATPSYAESIKIRKISETRNLDFNILEKILSEPKGNQHDKVSFNKEKIESVLPKELLKRDKRYIEEYIVLAIKTYNEVNKNKKIKQM